MRLRAKKRTVAITAASIVAMGTVAVGVPLAFADSGPSAASHYYVEIGGTGAALAQPDCTKTFGFANDNLAGGKPVKICYPASFGPLQAGDGSIPGPGAPSYEDSVKQGVDATMKAIEDIHANEPDATITVAGYSQGADVGDRVLERIAGGKTDIPAELMSGKLYADPRQPDTGIWAKVPAGTNIAGIVSPGPAPAELPGIPVERHCIHSDGVCDATSLDSFKGFFEQHPKYPADDGIIESTISSEAQNQVFWH
ncbi:MAG TPA: PE-PPE domain-containing protein [Stackebrandtia sp.]|uniref:PE-PPE domain-containing protein n=1 Tax=Stackebrandtia sp. TaxID=2023065 RepID=UPI002D6751D0|nr:PE-PPE domain-containing protein [Stackebrandtia sp.]HZE37606.1 PE-PPE domain-containing protein [Stackebrandtia sp.]